MHEGTTTFTSAYAKVDNVDDVVTGTVAIVSGVDVYVTSITHNGTTGKYFYFSAGHWIAAFGALVSPTYIHQTRNGVLIRSGYATMWSNLGRWSLDEAEGDWEIGDIIRNSVVAEGDTVSAIPGIPDVAGTLATFEVTY